MSAVRRMPSHRSFAAATASRTGLPSFSAIGQHFREEQLLDRAEELVGRQIVFARSRAPQHAHVQHHNFRLAALGAPQRRFQRIERVIRAHRHENVARLHAHVVLRQIGFLRQIELIEFDVASCRACFWMLFSESSNPSEEQAARR